MQLIAAEQALQGPLRGDVRVRTAVLDHLVELYAKWTAAAPDRARSAQASRWRAERAKVPKVAVAQAANVRGTDAEAR